MAIKLNHQTLVERCMELIAYDGLFRDIRSAFNYQSSGNRSRTSHAAGFVDEFIIVYKENKFSAIDKIKLLKNHTDIIKRQFEEISFNCQHDLVIFNCLIKANEGTNICFSIRYDWNGNLLNELEIFFGIKDENELDDKSLDNEVLVTLLKLA